MGSQIIGLFLLLPMMTQFDGSIDGSFIQLLRLQLSLQLALLDIKVPPKPLYLPLIPYHIIFDAFRISIMAFMRPAKER